MIPRAPQVEPNVAHLLPDDHSPHRRLNTKETRLAEDPPPGVLRPYSPEVRGCDACSVGALDWFPPLRLLPLRRTRRRWCTAGRVHLELRQVPAADAPHYGGRIEDALA